MTFHDWIHIPPLTDICELEKHYSKKERLISSSIYAFIIMMPLLLTWYYRFSFPQWVLIIFVIDYGLLTSGTIISWWIPYLFGRMESHKKEFTVYQNTHCFLPSRGENIIPNTLHVILHIQIWICFAISLYLLISFL
jgi:hypothetical protein